MTYLGFNTYPYIPSHKSFSSSPKKHLRHMLLLSASLSFSKLSVQLFVYSFKLGVVAFVFRHNDLHHLDHLHVII